MIGTLRTVVLDAPDVWRPAEFYTALGGMLDCPDAKELSAFYAKLLGKPVTYERRGGLTPRIRSSSIST